MTTTLAIRTTVRNPAVHRRQFGCISSDCSTTLSITTAASPSGCQMYWSSPSNTHHVWIFYRSCWSNQGAVLLFFTDTWALVGMVRLLSCSIGQSGMTCCF